MTAGETNEVFMTSIQHEKGGSNMAIKAAPTTGSTTHLTMEDKMSFRQDGFWQRRSAFEKILLLLLFITIIAFVVVLVFHIQEKSEKKSETNTIPIPQKDGQDVCVTKECVEIAATITSKIDYEVDPCDDFYQFSCGGWLKSNVLPGDRSWLSIFGQLRDKVRITLKNILEEEENEEEFPSMQNAKQLYKSCYNEDLIDSRRDKPLKDLLTNRFGGWPLTTPNWDQSSFNLRATFHEMEKLYVGGVITFVVGTDAKNSSRRIIYIDQPSFGMPGQKYYQVARNDTYLMAYQNIMYGIGEIMGFANPATAKQEVADIVDFEIRLANISVPSEERRDANKLYNKMTLAEVHGNYSHFLDWRQFVHDLFELPEVGVTDVTDDEIIINWSPPYYERLGQVLEETSTRTLANYLTWRVTWGFLATQGEIYADLIRKYRKILYGITRERERYHFCTSYTTGTFGLTVGRSFITDNFDATSKTIALEMIANLQSAFNELLDALDWMDQDTKEVAVEKNAHIDPKIGYSDDVLNDTLINERYKNLTFNKDTYFENRIKNNEESAYRALRSLREEINKTKWGSVPSTVNAFYSPTRNQIMFPAGILQPPFFSKHAPKSLNYGGIGMVIGHEITHGFDDQGRQFNKEGNLVQWWSESAVDKFKAKAQCIVDQYGNFTVEQIDKNLNGINTQGENIADNGGLRQAFRAYRNWVSRQGKEEQPLPGMDFTHNQLFFVSFAQIWCNKATDGSLLSSIRTGVHSPGQFRVIGSTQNSPDFAQAFNCPVGSYMNPGKKCGVW